MSEDDLEAVLDKLDQELHPDEDWPLAKQVSEIEDAFSENDSNNRCFAYRPETRSEDK